MSPATKDAKEGPKAPDDPHGPLTPEQKEQNLRDAIAEELQQVGRRRQAHGLEDTVATPAADARLYEEAGQQDLVGLALSGGGIRSATFNLGVLQGLAGLTQTGLLKYLDYLSTVSGGGYIGSWFAAWVSRAPGRLEEVEKQLRPRRIDQASPAGNSPPQGGPAEPGPIFHLRRYSNYLSPRLGFLSADVWVLWASYLRNLLACQLVLLPTAVGVLLLSRLFLLLYHTGTPEYLAEALGAKPAALGWVEWGLGVAVLALWFTAALLAFRGSGLVRP